jgi:hypothetical protein
MKRFEEYLNELAVPEHYRKSEGGRIPDHALYGTWLRRNDPTAFRCGFYYFKDSWRRK